MTDHNLDGIPQTSTSRPTPTGQRDVGPSVAPAGEEPRGTHDPLLDGITRYDDGDYEVELEPVADGIYLLFSDLPALLSAAREDERDKWMAFYRAEIEKDGIQWEASLRQRYREGSNDGKELGYEQGQRDERDKHHTHYCCAVCDYHVMPHRRCILR